MWGRMAWASDPLVCWDSLHGHNRSLHSAGAGTWGWNLGLCAFRQVLYQLKYISSPHKPNSLKHLIITIGILFVCLVVFVCGVLEGWWRHGSQGGQRTGLCSQFFPSTFTCAFGCLDLNLGPQACTLSALPVVTSHQIQLFLKRKVLFKLC